MNLVTVDFKSNQVEVIEEAQSVVVKDICKNIGLGYPSQYEKIQSDDSYESKLIKVQTAGGMQEVFTIPIGKLNGWLFSINPNKVKPEVKEKLIEYKKECFDVLNSYFNKGYAVNHSITHNKDYLSVRGKLGGLTYALHQRDKRIEELENQLKALPHLNSNDKLNIILKKTDELINIKYDGHGGFVEALQTHLRFHKEYIEAIQSGGSDLETFAIKTIKDAKEQKRKAQIKEHETKEEYNRLIDTLQSFIEISNRVSLLKKI